MGSRVGAVAVWVVLLALLLTPHVCQARAPLLPALNWVRLPGAESCISAADLAQRIESRLGHAVFVPTSAAELNIEGFVQPNDAPGGSGFRAQVAVVTADGRVLGTRTLDIPGSDCAPLEQALELVIAVTLNPDAAVNGMSLLSPENQAALDGWLADNPEPEASPARAPASPQGVTAGNRNRGAGSGGGPANIDAGGDPDAPWREAAASPYSVALGMLVGSGVLPGAALGAEASVTARWSGLWPLVASVQGLLPSTLRALNFEPGEVSFSLYRVAVLTCPIEARRERIRLVTCIGMDTGFWVAAASGYRFPSTAVRAAVDAQGQLGLLFGLVPGISVRAGLAIAMPLVRPRFETRQISGLRGEIYAAPSLQVLGQLGMSIEL